MTYAPFFKAFATLNAVVFVFFLSHMPRTPLGLISTPSAAVGLSAAFVGQGVDVLLKIAQLHSRLPHPHSFYAVG
jgi:hypothetical protein